VARARVDDDRPVLLQLRLHQPERGESKPDPPRADHSTSIPSRRSVLTEGRKYPAIAMKRTLMVTLLALAVIVVGFVTTWLTIPAGAWETKNLTTGEWETKRVGNPARLFRSGLVARERNCPYNTQYHPGCVGDTVTESVSLRTLKTRVGEFYGGLAVIVTLVALAFGDLRRAP
jgi:hypothetical protein